MKNTWLVRRSKRVRDDKLTAALYRLYLRCGGDLERFARVVRQWIKGGL